MLDFLGSCFLAGLFKDGQLPCMWTNFSRIFQTEDISAFKEPWWTRKCLWSLWEAFYHIYSTLPALQTSSFRKEWSDLWAMWPKRTEKNRESLLRMPVKILQNCFQCYSKETWQEKCTVGPNRYQEAFGNMETFTSIYVLSNLVNKCTTCWMNLKFNMAMWKMKPTDFIWWSKLWRTKFYKNKGKKVNQINAHTIT